MSPVDINLAQAPFFDDFNTQNFYYKILFQPGVSVQTRELTNSNQYFKTKLKNLVIIYLHQEQLFLDVILHF